MAQPVKIVIANAFSLSMLPRYETYAASSYWLYVQKLPLCAVRRIIERAQKMGVPIISAVGHASTAQLLSKLLGIEVPASRTAITMNAETMLIVFQLLERLPEGKVLTEEEVKQLLEQGKAAFFVIRYSVPPSHQEELFEAATKVFNELTRAVLPCE